MENPDLVLQETGSRPTYSRLNYVPSRDTLRREATSSFISLRDLHRIRRFLSVDTSVVIANALVSSRLDYCNFLFRSLSSHNATRLQYVQNALARFVTGASKYTHITSTLRTLHWLPIRQCIIFRTLVLVYKYLTTGQPKYFAPYLSLYKSAMKTRRSNPQNLFLQVPHY